jgi:hypothetical protein
MGTFRIMSLSIVLVFCASLKPVCAEQQFVNIILNLPNAQNYGYIVRADHGGVQIMEGQDIENQKFFTFQTVRQIAKDYNKQMGDILPFTKRQSVFDEEAQQYMPIIPIVEEEIQKSTPIIKIIIDNSWYSSWGYKTKKILITPVHITSEQIQDDVTDNSYVCALHVEDGKVPGYTQQILLNDKSKCIQITRGQASSIYP